MQRHQGFTLVEMLVVIAIMGILISMTVPAVSYVREIARKTSCSNNISNLLRAVQMYESLVRTYPPGRVGCDCGDSISYRKCKSTGTTTLSGYHRTGSSGFLMLLPQLDERQLYDSFNRFRNGAVFPAGDDHPPDGSTCADSETSGWRAGITGGNETLLTRPKVFVCPSSRDEETFEEAATSCYAFCMGTLGPSYPDPDKARYYNSGVFMFHRALGSRDVVDGLANTIFIGEVTDSHTSRGRNRWMIGSLFLDSLRTTEYVEWHRGVVTSIENEQEVKKDDKTYGTFASPHNNGINFGFGDGRVVFLTDDVEVSLLNNLSTRDANAFAAFSNNRVYREVHNLPF